MSRRSLSILRENLPKVLIFQRRRNSEDFRSFAARSSAWPALSLAAAAVAAAGFYGCVDFQPHQAIACCDSKKEGDAELVFIGSGSSTGCPKPLCALMFANRKGTLGANIEGWREKCRISNLAMKDGSEPKRNRDYRNNPSLLLRQYDPKDGRVKNVLIDAGKTFREGALRWFPEHDVRTLDAIVLTHHHMDAVGGLDDVRGFQQFEPGPDGQPPTRVAIQVYLSELCRHHLSYQFPWLIRKEGGNHSQSADGGPSAVKRDVANLDSRIFQNYRPFRVHGMTLTPLPVWHGDDLICHGFEFTLTNRDGTEMNVVYLSDISRMIPETLEHIQRKPTDLLIIDSLLWHSKHPVHFSLDQAIELSKVIKPRRQTLVLGMSCDAFLPHDEMNAWLKDEYGVSKDGVPTVQMAHDGLSVSA